MGVALLLVFCSCEKQGEQEQGTQGTEQGQVEKPEPESPEEPPLVENWDLIENTRAEVGNRIMKNCSIWLHLPDL